MSLNVQPSLERAGSISLSRQTSSTAQPPRRSGTAQTVQTEATASLQYRSRQIQLFGDRNESLGVPALARSRIPEAYLARPSLLSEFLEFGVCREQYFNEVSLREELAAEARLFAQAIAAEPHLQVAPEDQQQIQSLQSSLPPRALLENADIEASQKSQPKPSGSIRVHEKQRSAAAVTEGKRERSSQNRRAENVLREGSKSTLKARREARRMRWQQYAVMAAAAGVEPGAVELAAKRRLQAERRNTPQTASTSGREQLLQSPGRSRSINTLDSALDLLLGRQGSVLERHEEHRLIRDMQEGLAIHQTIEDLGVQTADLSVEALTERLGMTLDEISEKLSQGLQAKQVLLHANKRLVFKLAHSFGLDRRVPFEEYVLAGMEGLMEGLLKFDPGRGHKLSSLLVWWIRNSLSTVGAALNNVVHIPKKVQLWTTRIARTHNQLTYKLGRQPSSEELCQELGLSPTQLRDLSTVAKRDTVQLEDLLSSSTGSAKMAKAWGGSVTEVDLDHSQMLEAPAEDTPQHMVKCMALESSMDQLLESISPRDAAVVRELYGIRSETGLARKGTEVADKFDILPRRVCQIRHEVLNQLREAHHATLQQVAEYATC